MSDSRTPVVIPKGRSYWIFFAKYSGIPIAIRDLKPTKGPEEGEPIWGIEGEWREVVTT